MEALWLFVGIVMAESAKFNAVTHRIPLEVKHGVNGLNLDPPVTLLQGVSDQVAVVAVADDELVAVLNVGVFERNFANRALKDGILSAPHCSFILIGLGRLSMLL